MGTVKNVELSMQSVRRLLERNHLAYTIEKDSLLFNRRFNRRTGQKSYYYIGFTEGEKKIGRQSIVFGCVDYNVYDEDFAMGNAFARRCVPTWRFSHSIFTTSFPISIRPTNTTIGANDTNDRLCRRTDNRLQGLFLCNDQINKAMPAP